MYFANEIRSVPEFGALENAHLKPQEVKLAEQLIGTMTQPFKPTRYHDEFQERLHKLIEAKRHGQAVESVPEPKFAPVIDMMAALKKSLAARAATSKQPEEKKLPSRTRKPQKAS
jgi:DNA end-binding protein Ku